MILTYVKNIIKILIPHQLKSRIISRIENRKQSNYLTQLKSKIIKFYENKINRTSEEEEVINYLMSNPISVFPYDFQEKYNKSDIEVLEDFSNGLRYVLHDNKKLYFKRSYTVAKIKSLYHGLLLDQDPNSPHLYLTKDFNLNEKDVIADIGAAEGNFSLSNIETVKKIYLFECDSEWIEALEATFSPWKEKVIICNKFVSNIDNKNSITLDTFIKEKKTQIRFHTLSFFRILEKIEFKLQDYLAHIQQVENKNKHLEIVRDLQSLAGKMLNIPKSTVTEENLMFKIIAHRFVSIAGQLNAVGYSDLRQGVWQWENEDKNILLGF